MLVQSMSLEVSTQPGRPCSGLLHCNPVDIHKLRLVSRRPRPRLRCSKTWSAACSGNSAPKHSISRTSTLSSENSARPRSSFASRIAAGAAGTGFGVLPGGSAA